MAANARRIGTHRRRAGAIVLAALLLAIAGLAIAPAAAEPAPSRHPQIEPFANPAFFPIAVWLQNPDNAERYRAAGINVYVGLWKGPTAAQLQRLSRAGMWVICAQNDLALTHPERNIIIGWLQPDEPDNAQPRGAGLGYGPPVPPHEVVETYRAMRERDPLRPVLLNLGQGVAWDHWHGRGARTNHPEDYPDYVKGGDIVSFDIYPVTHPHPEVAGRLEYVARGVTRLRGWARDGQTVWNAVGVSRIGNADVKPTAAEVRAQVWMSLIHGSQGIIYFVHQFKPRFIEAALFEDPEVLSEVTRINAQIRSLAPVLNSPSVENAVAIDDAGSGVPIATMTKRFAGETYLFTVAMAPRPATVTVRDRTGAAAGRVTVLGEDRTIEIRDGAFTDTFAPYGVHLYRY